MRGSRPGDLSEDVTQKVPQIIGAFVAGVVLVLGSAAIYSNVQQRNQPVNAINSASSGPPREAAKTPEPTSGEQATVADYSAAEASASEKRDALADSSAGDEAVATQPPANPIPRRSLRSSPVRPNRPQPNEKHPTPEAPVPAAELASDLRTPEETASAIPLEVGPKSQEQSPPPAHPNPVTIRPGTTITIRTVESVSTADARTGDTFPASLASPLVVDGVVVAAAGSKVVGRVEKSHKPSLLGGRSELTLTLAQITLADGRVVALNTNSVEQKGGHGSVVNTAKMATGAAVGAVVGALSGAAEGAGLGSGEKNSNKTFRGNSRTLLISAGTQMTFNVASPLTVTLNAFPSN